MHDGFRGSELRAAGPTAVLDTEHVEGKWRSADGDDAVLADDAVLLAAADELAGEEQKRALAAIDENKLVDGGAGRGLLDVNGPAIARACQAFGALLTNEDVTGSETFFKSEEKAGVLAD